MSGGVTQPNDTLLCGNNQSLTSTTIALESLNHSSESINPKRISFTLHCLIHSIVNRLILNKTLFLSYAAVKSPIHFSEPVYTAGSGNVN